MQPDAQWPGRQGAWGGGRRCKGGGLDGRVDPGGGGAQCHGLAQSAGRLRHRAENGQGQCHRGRRPGTVEPSGGHGLCRRGDHAEDGDHDEEIADGGGDGLPGGLGALGVAHLPTSLRQCAAASGQGAEGKQFAQPVDGLHRVGRQRGHGRAGAAAACRACAGVGEGRRGEQGRDRQDGHQQPRLNQGQKYRAAGEDRSRREQLGGGVGVEELERLHVGHGGGGEVAAAAARDPGGRAAGQSVEDADPQCGQDPVGKVVGEVHLPPGHQGPRHGEGHERGDGAGRGSVSVDDGGAHGMRGQGQQRDEGSLFEDGGDAGAGRHGAVPGEGGQQGAQRAPRGSVRPGGGGTGGGRTGGGAHAAISPRWARPASTSRV